MTHNDLFQTLKEDHQDVKNILQRMMQKNVPVNHNLQEQLKYEILPHMEGEEKSLYPALKDHKEASVLAFEAIEEHRLAQLELKEVERLSPGSEEWQARVKVLKELIEHHIQDEETEVFKAARELLSDDQLDAIYKKFMQVKEKAMSKA